MEWVPRHGGCFGGAGVGLCVTVASAASPASLQGHQALLPALQGRLLRSQVGPSVPPAAPELGPFLYPVPNWGSRWL